MVAGRGSAGRGQGVGTEGQAFGRGAPQATPAARRAGALMRVGRSSQGPHWARWVAGGTRLPLSRHRLGGSGGKPGARAGAPGDGRTPGMGE